MFNVVFLRCHSLCAEYFYLYTDDDRRKMIRGIGGISIKSEATSSALTAGLTHSQTAQGNSN